MHTHTHTHIFGGWVVGICIYQAVGVTATSQPSDHYAVLAQVLLPTETEAERSGDSV
jgi:hypothetical protein